MDAVFEATIGPPDEDDYGYDGCGGVTTGSHSTCMWHYQPVELHEVFIQGIQTSRYYVPYTVECVVF